MEEKSGVKFQEAEVALARQWVGEAFESAVVTDDESKTNVAAVPMSTVSLAMPVESENVTVSVEGVKNELKATEFKLPATVSEAKDIIEQFERGADGLRGDENVSDNVNQHRMIDHTSLLEEKWLGTEEEELNAYVSELVYIHSKLMIVDDRRVLVSASSLILGAVDELT